MPTKWEAGLDDPDLHRVGAEVQSDDIAPRQNSKGGGAQGEEEHGEGVSSARPACATDRLDWNCSLPRVRRPATRYPVPSTHSEYLCSIFEKIIYRDIKTCSTQFSKQDDVRPWTVDRGP